MHTNEGFIEDIRDSAIAACKGKGLFPSIVIAQACLESNFGLSGLSLNCNNFFGIKAGSHWEGPVRNYPTNEYIRGKTISVRADFCRFKDFEECLSEHNAMLIRVPVYARHGLFKCATAESQAITLRLAGYATDPKYSQRLLAIVSKYNLKQYDCLIDGTSVPFSTI